MLSTCDELDARLSVSRFSDTTDALTEILDRIVASTAALDAVLKRLKREAASASPREPRATTDVSGFVGGSDHDY